MMRCPRIVSAPYSEPHDFERAAHRPGCPLTHYTPGYLPALDGRSHGPAVPPASTPRGLREAGDPQGEPPATQKLKSIGLISATDVSMAR